MSYYEQMGFLAISDTRNCAVNRAYALDGLKKSICYKTLEPIKINKLIQSLENYSESEILSNLNELIDNKLIIKINDKVLFLAVPRERIAYNMDPGMIIGFIDQKDRLEGKNDRKRSDRIS